MKPYWNRVKTVNKVVSILKHNVTIEVKNGIPFGLKQVHSFTMRCLLCKPMGCHGDHMLRQVNMALRQNPEALTGSVETQCNKIYMCFIGLFLEKKTNTRGPLASIWTRLGQMATYEENPQSSLIKPLINWYLTGCCWCLGSHCWKRESDSYYLS